MTALISLAVITGLVGVNTLPLLLIYGEADTLMRIYWSPLIVIVEMPLISMPTNAALS